MKARVKLTPSQKKYIDAKFLEQKKKRLLKNVVFDKNTNAKDKLKIVRTIINLK